MSNGRRLQKETKRLPGHEAHPPDGRVRRLWWRVRRWLGVH